MIYKLRSNLLYYKNNNSGFFANKPVDNSGSDAVTVTINGHHFDFVNSLIEREGGLLLYTEIESIPSCTGRAPKDIQTDIHRKLRKEGLIVKGTRSDNLIKASSNDKGKGLFIDYIKCIDPTEKNEIPSKKHDKALTSNTIDIKGTASACFVHTMVDYNYIEGDSKLSSLSIKKNWLPSLNDGQEQHLNLHDFIINKIAADRLSHFVLFSEPGAGKTYSIFDAVKSFLSKDILYKNKHIIPVYYSSLMLSINNLSLIELIAKQFYNSNAVLARNAFRVNSNVHFILFIDAINESTNSNNLLEEIINLSYPINKNVSFIVATNNPDESQILQNSDFSEVVLNPLEMRVVNKAPKSSSLSLEFKSLLRKPFYLKRYLLSQDVSNVNDEYSVMDEYIQECKKTGKITKARDFNKWVSLLDKEFPKQCYNWALEQKLYFYPNEPGTEYETLRKNDNIRRLVQIGVLKQFSDSVYFEHEIYRNYFAAKHIYNKCADLCNNPDVPIELKLKLKDELTQIIDQAPINVCMFLAPKLYHDGLLKKLIEQYGALRNSKEFCKTIVNLFSLHTTTLDGLDFTGADLWITDLSRFDRIINCNFSKANINPETIWLHHANISYAKSNSGRIKNDLVFLYGPEGYEIYNWKNDRQAFIRIPDEILVDSWHLTPTSLLILSSDNQYCITYTEINSILHSNTEDCDDVFTITNKFATDILPDKEFYHDTSVLINHHGDKLSYNKGEELYISHNGKSALSCLCSSCNYATFIDDNTVFTDCDGVYMIITLEGTLLWKRMIKPVVPQFMHFEGNSAIIRMLIPGITAPKHFIYDLISRRSQLASSNVSNKLDHDSSGSSESLSNTLEIFDCNHSKHLIFGGAIELTNSLFSNKTTIVFRPIDDTERQILGQFGGIVI